MSARKKIEELSTIILLFILAFTIRFIGGTWETKWDNDAYMARQAEYIYSLDTRQFLTRSVQRRYISPVWLIFLHSWAG